MVTFRGVQGEGLRVLKHMLVGLVTGVPEIKYQTGKSLYMRIALRLLIRGILTLPFACDTRINTLFCVFTLTATSSSAPEPINDRRELFGWYVYDWANSAFYTTVVTVFMGPYLTEVTKAAADANGYVYPLGIKVAAGS